MEGAYLLNSPRLGSGMVHRVGFRAWRFGRSLYPSPSQDGWWAVSGCLALWCLVAFTFAWVMGLGIFATYNGRDQYPPGGWMDGWMGAFGDIHDFS